jgi:hypothetical protein
LPLGKQARGPRDGLTTVSTVLSNPASTSAVGRLRGKGRKGPYQPVEKGDWLRTHRLICPRRTAGVRCLSPFSTGCYVNLPQTPQHVAGSVRRCRHDTVYRLQASLFRSPPSRWSATASRSFTGVPAAGGSGPAFTPGWATPTPPFVNPVHGVPAGRLSGSASTSAIRSNRSYTRPDA